jgi:hypothetical protein
LGLPVLNSAVFNPIDLDEDGADELLYQVAVRPDGVSEYLSYVRYTIQPQVNAQILRSTATFIPFEHGLPINSTNPNYQFPNSSSKALPFIGFSEELVFPNWFYFDRAFALPEPFFTNKTSLLIGFRADLEDGRHYGWLSFSRPYTTFTTPFNLNSWNWNPVPDLPIKAGLPPEIPLTTTVVDEGASPVLRITWPAAVASWNFESTTNLVYPGIWEPYPSGGTTVDVPHDESAEPIRYFRLRQPQRVGGGPHVKARSTAKRSECSSGMNPVKEVVAVLVMTILPNQITGANAGGPRQLPMRTRWAARVAQFHR